MVERNSEDPFIKSSFELRGPLFVVLVIQNIGKTGAIDVSVEISLDPSDFKRTLLFPLLIPGQKVRLILPESNIKVLAEKFTTLKLDGECMNISGKNITIDDKINVKSVLESWIQGRILLEETVSNRLSQIADRIERLERSVERMLSTTSGVLVKTPEDQKKELEEIEKRYYKEQASKREKKASESG